jgi:hypothetical protein
VLLKVEELLWFDHSEGAINAPAFEDVVERPRRSVAGVVPALERDQRARSAEEGSFETSYRIHLRKAIGQVS